MIVAGDDGRTARFESNHLLLIGRPNQPRTRPSRCRRVMGHELSRPTEGREAVHKCDADVDLGGLAVGSRDVIRSPQALRRVIFPSIRIRM